MIIFRDRQTGRFVARSTWTRSRAQLPAGTPGRFVRQQIQRRPPRPLKKEERRELVERVREELAALEEEELEVEDEFEVSADYA